MAPARRMAAHCSAGGPTCKPPVGLGPTCYTAPLRRAWIDLEQTMSTNPTDPSPHRAPLYRLTLGALGIVFGDIGTSPLYTMRESLASGVLQPENILGVLSLIFW